MFSQTTEGLRKKQFIGSMAVLRSESGGSAWQIGSKKDLDIFPKSTEQFNNIPNIAINHVFKEYKPSQPLFNSNSKILTMGSCFADRLRLFLRMSGHAAENIDVPAGLNNSYAIRQFIEWALTGKQASDGYWYDEADGEIIKYTTPSDHQLFRSAFQEMDGFVVTLGLSEVWRDKKTGGVFWRGVPKEMFNTEEHEYVLTSSTENAQNIQRIIELIREHCGDKPIILTLSPVPLAATFSGKPCISADCVSKSILRVALNEIESQEFDGVYYWPSFELVKWVGAHTNFNAYGGDGSSRHVAEGLVKLIIDQFVGSFFD